MVSKRRLSRQHHYLLYDLMPYFNTMFNVCVELTDRLPNVHWLVQRPHFIFYYLSEKLPLFQKLKRKPFPILFFYQQLSIACYQVSL